MVYRRKKVFRTVFRKLPLHAPYWLATNLATAPTIKMGRASSLGGWSTTTGAPTLTAVADKSVAVVRVPPVFLGLTNANG